MLALALGVGMSSAIYGVVHAMTLRPLPYPRPDRIVAVSQLRLDLPAGGRLGILHPELTRILKRW